MFMMDIMLLYLIKSEAWLRRSGKPLSVEALATQLDLHTTKFGFMKSFMPKAVAVVAEALPLAILQVWWQDPKEQCCTLPDPPGSTCSWAGMQPDTIL
eukprot:gene12471-18084_t